MAVLAHAVNILEERKKKEKSFVDWTPLRRAANQQRVFIKQGKSRHVTSATSDSKQSNPIIAVLK